MVVKRYTFLIFIYHLELGIFAHGDLEFYSPFVCLIVRGFSSHSKSFRSYVDVIITGEGLQNLAYVLIYTID